MKENPFSLEFRCNAGKIIQLTDHISRIIAPNSSPMTFTGTNTYIVGKDELAIIDPGPNDNSHLQSILASIKPYQKITHILITHSHIDHSPLAKALQNETRAKIYAFGDCFAGKSSIMKKLSKQGTLEGGEGLDLNFRPDIFIDENTTIENSEWSLEVIHTPGHLSNHICFGLKDENVLFSGDHVMGWATSLISPPDGDLTQFMSSLRKLMSINDYNVFYPGHGDIITNPKEVMKYIIEHREMRERQILDALKDLSLNATQLTESIYTDVDKFLIPAAARNVFAHLINLGERNLVVIPENLSFNSSFKKNI